MDRIYPKTRRMKGDAIVAAIESGAPNPKLSDARRRGWETRRKNNGASGSRRRRVSVFLMKRPESDGGSTT